MLSRSLCGGPASGCCRLSFFEAVKSCKHYSTPTRRRHSPCIAIIGSGPAGFYSAYRLQKKLPEVRIDMYESLPVPFGLARFGVAPDHPEVKKCTDTLVDVAKSPNFNFLGNIPIGNDRLSLPIATMAVHYDGIIFAYGACKDKTLGLPGEDLLGVLSARAFVGWYNGLPEHADLRPDLEAGDTAVVIGQGNVALDVTRILLAPLEELRKTDISEEAVEVLSRSKIRDVKVIGRRGPLQAPYTIKELREIMQLPDVGFAPPPESWDELMQAERKTLPRQLKRIAELLERGSKVSPSDSHRAWQLGYLRSPVAFLSSDNTHLEAVGFERTEYVESLTSVMSGDPQSDLNSIRALRVRSLGQNTLVRASTAFRSVGYKSEPLGGLEEVGVPFDRKLGIIPNDRWGRILSPAEGPAGLLTATHVPGMYCAGWVKRGPTGVIASTLDDAFATADIVAKDWQEGVKFANEDDEPRQGWEAVKEEVSRRGIQRVSWEDWQRIDLEERRRGKAKGKEREKIRRVDEMLQLLHS